MSDPADGSSDYRILGAGVIFDAFRRIERRATREGRWAAVLSAMREIRERLRRNPMEFGEPMYRLTAFRLQVRSAMVGPLAVHFGVSEDRPLVFIKAVDLMPMPES